MVGLSQAELDRFLEKTSRTFALAIPLLPESLRTDVGAAYLLFRIADTLEDATLWNREARVHALASFASWLDGGSPSFIGDVARSHPINDDACVELVTRAEDVRAAITAPTRPIILSHVERTAEGMRAFVEAQDEEGRLVLEREADLVSYCYAVAGIVGEMLTELFLLSDPKLAAVATRLRADAAVFGEGLQLVNILKDAPSDARDGRSYLPSTLDRSLVVLRARHDLEGAERYVAALVEANAEEGVIAFCALALRLAKATLDALDRGEAKLSRESVLAIVGTLSAAR